MLKQIIHRWERKLSTRDNNRVTRPFEWGIEFLEPEYLARTNGHRPDAREIIHKFNERAIADSHNYFKPPATPEFYFEGEYVKFKSTVETPFEQNNTVYARYFPVPPSNGNLNGSRAHEVERAEGRAVVVLPHWNARPVEHVATCQWLNRTGIAALRLTLPYHEQRMLPGFERADYMVSANVGRTLQSMRQAVLDTRSAIDWLFAQGYTRIGLLGTSLGSCIGFLAFIHDKRLRAGVYLHVSSYFGDVVWEGITTAHVRRGLESKLTREEVRKVWLAISPNSYINRLKHDNRRGLLISARYDLSFTPELSRLLFDECDRHEVRLDRAIIPCGHYTLGRVPYKFYVGYRLVSYFRKHL
ncbi:MAG TPA: hypothetical protein VNN73_05310 [Blastocatellia bacterium]|nr:hypothetical protein [Blastocatellia bacterium]